jgi:hypothetical protein
MGQQLADAAPVTLYPLLIVMLSFLFLATLSVVGYLLKDLKSSFEKAQKRQDDDIDKVADRLSNLEKSLPIQFVLRDDFVRAIAGLDLKIDRMLREVFDLNKRLAKFLGSSSEADLGKGGE